jgi:hypothetical protein
LTKEHFNLYYVFAEDEKNTPVPAALIERLQKNFELFWEKAKPPPPLKPPNRQKGQESPEHTKSS